MSYHHFLAQERVALKHSQASDLTSLLAESGGGCNTPLGVPIQIWACRCLTAGVQLPELKNKHLLSFSLSHSPSLWVMRCVISGPLNSSINGSQLRAERLWRGSSFCCSCLVQKWILRFTFRWITFYYGNYQRSLMQHWRLFAREWLSYCDHLNISQLHNIVYTSVIWPSVGMNTWQLVCITCFMINTLQTSRIPVGLLTILLKEQLDNRRLLSFVCFPLRTLFVTWLSHSGFISSTEKKHRLASEYSSNI